MRSVILTRAGENQLFRTASPLTELGEAALGAALNDLCGAPPIVSGLRQNCAVEAAAEMGFDRKATYSALQDVLVKDRLVRENERAIAKGVFGSPFFIVDGEPFWGSDRIEPLAGRH